MKKILSILACLFFGWLSPAQKAITKSEGRIILPYEVNLPDTLKNPFSEDKIRYNTEAWLVPDTPQYLLIQAKHPSILNDTLELEKAKELLTLLSKVRPNFPERSGQLKSYYYFFRTKDYAPSKLGLRFSKVIYCADGRIFEINLPLTADICDIVPGYISYLAETKKGKFIISSEATPDSFPLKSGAAKILTLTSLKPDL